MLPQIRAQARVAFGGKSPERREELIAEVFANCWVAFVRLMERGLGDVVYPRYAPSASGLLCLGADGRSLSCRQAGRSD